MQQYMSDTFKSDQAKDDMDKVDYNNLLSILDELTKEPHLAGSERDFETAEYVRKKFMDYGLDAAEVTPT